MSLEKKLRSLVLYDVTVFLLAKITRASWNGIVTLADVRDISRRFDHTSRTHTRASITPSITLSSRSNYRAADNLIQQSTFRLPVRLPCLGEDLLFARFFSFSPDRLSAKTDDVGGNVPRRGLKFKNTPLYRSRLGQTRRDYFENQLGSPFD